MSRGGARVRPERVAEQIRVEIAGILQRDLKDPRVGLATCTRVQLSRDLKVAKIYVSVLGVSDEQKRAMAALEGASGFVRRLLGQRLGLRASPEVRFLFDPAVEYGIRLERLLEESRGQGAPSESPPEREAEQEAEQEEDNDES
ncbi:MAG: 30S ribosome-binding factor RbfA [Vicinamibacteria bacterium]